MNGMNILEYSRKLFSILYLITHSLALDVKLNSLGYKSEDVMTFGLCQCDMTGGICDVYCCCDDDCSEEASDAFACDATVPTVESAEILSDWRCDDVKSEKDFQFSSFLCIQKENSPYLGHFFPPPKVIRDLPSLNSLLSKQRHLWGNIAVPDIIVGNKIGSFRTPTGYIFGQNLEVQVISSLGNQDTKFPFPYSIYNGRCDLISPVRFLKDLTSSCNTKVGSLHDFSLPNSLFSVSTFLVGNISDRNLLSFPGNKTVFANVSTIYQQAANPCCYLTATNCSLSTACTKNVITPPNNVLRPICTNGICSNVVLEVEYHFFWKGQAITWLNITFTLSDVPLVSDQGSFGFLRQRFSIKYIYQSSFNVSDVIVNNTSTTRSGKYGYEIGLPLTGSTLFRNETDFEKDTSSGIKTYLYVPTYGK